MNKEPICTPDQKAWLEKEGSYPSGHTAAGWGWALILSGISPEQTDAIHARGIAFGESRNARNAHWHSDVVQGRWLPAPWRGCTQNVTNQKRMGFRKL